MKQINHGFQEYYYLLEDGTVLNKNTNKIIKPNKKHLFVLKTVDDEVKKIALSTLYKALFNKNYCKDDIQDLEGEIWQPIKGTEELYHISNKGRVKSCAGYNAIILNPYSNAKGYLRVDIVIEGKRQSKLVHRLVAAAFLDPPEDIDMQLHHKSFDKRCNAAEDLCWMTAAAHAKIHAEQHKKKGEENNGSENNST